jgi:DNA gyrase subunit A
VLNVKEMLNEFLKFRHEIILRRTKYELELAEKRAHILEGLKIALDNIDEVVDTIKKSRTVDTARLNLMKRFALSEVQAQAILDMRLQRLTGLERKKIEQEYLNLIKLIEKLKSLLSSKERRMQLVKKELLELKEKYADSRRTQIIGEKSESPAKSLITEEETLVTLSLQGVVRRFSAEAVRANKELVKSAEPGDFVESLFYTSNSHNFLFFTDQGRCYNLRASYIPLASANENGVPVGRLVHLKPDEKIVRTMEFTTLNEEKFVTIATMQGVVKKVALSSLSKPSEDGFNIISLKDKDRMVDAVLTSGGDDVLIASAQGFGIRFSEQDIRDMGLQAAGVRGMSLAQNDKVIGLITLRREKSTLLTVTDLGFGKRNQLDEYNRIKRGGKGIVTYKISDKVGHLAAVLEVQENDEILFITRKGKVKRLKAKFVKVMGRSTQGMAVANIAKNDVIDRAIFAPKIRSS